MTTFKAGGSITAQIISGGDVVNGGQMELEVYSINAKRLGTAASFGEAKRMQLAALPDDLKEAYAGYQDGAPIFYSHLLSDELLEKYPALKGDDA